MRLKNLTGQKSGTFTIIQLVHINGKGKLARWLCECSCGHKEVFLADNLHTGKIQCKNGCSNDGYLWEDCGEISKQYWVSIKRGAEQRNKEFNITIKYIWDLFLKQNRKCAYTNKTLHFSGNKTASLDRIDSSKGYIEGNVQWIHKDINKMKFTFSDEYFVQTCKQIAELNILKSGIYNG